MTYGYVASKHVSFTAHHSTTDGCIGRCEQLDSTAHCFLCLRMPEQTNGSYRGTWRVTAPARPGTGHRGKPCAAKSESDPRFRLRRKDQACLRDQTSPPLGISTVSYPQPPQHSSPAVTVQSVALSWVGFSPERQAAVILLRRSVLIEAIYKITDCLSVCKFVCLFIHLPGLCVILCSTIIQLIYAARTQHFIVVHIRFPVKKTHTFRLTKGLCF